MNTAKKVVCFIGLSALVFAPACEHDPASNSGCDVEEASIVGEDAVVLVAQRGGGGGGGGARGGGSGVGTRGSGGSGVAPSGKSSSLNSAPRGSSVAPKQVSKPPKTNNISSTKYHSYSPRYHSNNSWMWFYYAMFVANSDDPDEEDFEGWLESQDEDDLADAELEYRDKVC